MVDAGAYRGLMRGQSYGVMKRDTRSLEYSADGGRFVERGHVTLMPYKLLPCSGFCSLV